MNSALKQNFDRIVAARERLLEVRAERVASILRLQSYLRARLDEFFTNLDPISGSRLADLGSEGSKASGEMTMILAMFDGSRMKIAVDGMGRYSHEAEPNVFEGVGEILNFDISPDFATASMDYVPTAGASRRPVRVTFDGYVDRLVQHTLESIEGEIAPSSGAPVSVAPVAAVPTTPILQAVPEYDLPRIARPTVQEVPPAHLEPVTAFRAEEPPMPYRFEEPAAPVYRNEEPAAPAYRRELPRLDAERELDPVRYSERAPEPIRQVERTPEPIRQAERAPEPIRQAERMPEPVRQAERSPDPVRYSEKVRPLERPRSLEMEHDMDRIARTNGAALGEMPMKPRGLSFSVR
jgi:hypothetical protein